MSENKIKQKGLLKRVRSSINTKNFILISALIIFASTLIYMQIGSSEITPYETAENPIVLKEKPKDFSIPNQDNDDIIGGFNISEDFNELPGFNIPANVIANLPESFGSGTYGGIPDLDAAIDDAINGGIKDPTGGGFDIPDIDPNLINPGDDLGGGNGVSNNNGGTGGDTIFGSGQPVGTSTPSNKSLTGRNDKARNLPEVGFIDLSFINFNFLNFQNIQIQISVVKTLFVVLLFVPLIMNNIVTPILLKASEEFDINSPKVDSIFFKPKPNLAELKRKKERVRKLLIFKDHVDRLIFVSEERIKVESAAHTIIYGYHELDRAFGEFSKLIRSKHMTPLEHSNQHFETGEINNAALESIVNLFYEARYANRNLPKEAGFNFINLLTKLVLEKYEIEAQLRLLNNEINETSAKI